MASASDDFNRADGDIGANWTVNAGNWDISGNLCVQRTSPGAYYSAWYDATAPATDDFYSEAIIVSPSSAIGSGVAVRIAAAANTFYGYVFFGGDAAYLVEITAGVEGILDTGAAATGGVSYTARLEANGTALTGTRNAAADVSATDASLASGNWGLMAYGGVGTGTTQSWNDWTAADLAAPPAGDTGFMTTMRGYWGP